MRKLNEMNFAESITYLYSLGNEVTAMKLGLENPRRLLQALGNPHEKFREVQVAGTNGKGSTCAFLDSICRHAGIKTGLFTSPHLVEITERVKIDGQQISEEKFAEFASTVREMTESEGLYATFFEQITAIALLAFAEKGVELAILETGLGGRLDATTAARAEIVAITPVDLDHQQYLGDSIAEIAAEKAAIINETTRAVVSSQHPDALKVILARCDEVSVEPLRTDFDWPGYQLSLAGKHQIENAKVAIRLAEILKIDKESIEAGLKTAVHRGRLEYFGKFLLDGAHNRAGAEALREYVESEHLNDRITMIFGAMEDKEIDSIAGILFPLADQLILTKPDNPRAAEPELLTAFVTQKMNVTRSVPAAIKLAQSLSADLIVVTGSLYLVGEAQKVLRK